MALDTRKTEWKRNRKSRKSRMAELKKLHNGSTNGHKKSHSKNNNNNNNIKSKSNWDSKSSILAKAKNSQKNSQKHLLDQSPEIADEEVSEVTLTFAAQSQDPLNRITESTPVEFADIHFNHQVGFI